MAVTIRVGPFLRDRIAGFATGFAGAASSRRPIVYRRPPDGMREPSRPNR